MSVNPLQEKTNIAIVLFMLGAGGCRFRLAQMVLDAYPLPFFGYLTVADPHFTEDDIRSELKIATIETAQHFERADVINKFHQGKPISHGYFLTKIKWQLTQNLERAGVIDRRDHRKAKDGTPFPKKPARFGRSVVAMSLDDPNKNCPQIAILDFHHE